MKLEEFRSIAESMGIHAGKLSKVELIKALQTGEGNFDCFATASSGEWGMLNVPCPSPKRRNPSRSMSLSHE